VPGNETSSIVEFTSYLGELVRLSLRKALLLTADGIGLRQSNFWTDLVLPPDPPTLVVPK